MNTLFNAAPSISMLMPFSKKRTPSHGIVKTKMQCSMQITDGNAQFHQVETNDAL